MNINSSCFSTDLLNIKQNLNTDILNCLSWPFWNKSYLQELASYVFICILVFSNGVLSAAYSHLSGLIIAETIFIFMALAVYMVDSLLTLKIFSAGHYYE
ncbi:unnamed protein product [Heterobilharzia americana]|nr:unnamed protein product [Heterobilharzia americana]